jgi:hypothetical protein
MVKEVIHRSEKKNGRYRWAALSDGSEKSLKSLYTICKILNREKDELVVIVVDDGKIDMTTVAKDV